MKHPVFLDPQYLNLVNKSSFIVKKALKHLNQALSSNDNRCFHETSHYIGT